MFHVWEWFIDLNAARNNQSGFNGAVYSGIQFSEIKAYFELFDISYNYLEIELLKGIDALYVRIMNSDCKSLEEWKNN